MVRQALFSLAVLLLLLVVAQGCASTNQLAGSEEDDWRWQNRSTVVVDDPSVSLANYLQQIPGLYVSGSGTNAEVFVRGFNSLQSNMEPLFVVNNQQIGNSYSAVNGLVNVNDIRYIDVIKGPEASSIYGLRGNNGVIIIQTRNR